MPKTVAGIPFIFIYLDDTLMPVARGQSLKQRGARNFKHYYCALELNRNRVGQRKRTLSSAMLLSILTQFMGHFKRAMFWHNTLALGCPNENMRFDKKS